MISILQTTNTTLSGFTIHNAPLVHMLLSKATGVSVTQVNIQTPTPDHAAGNFPYNSDGLDISGSSNVQIDRVDFSTGAPVIIYDPQTTTLTNGQYLRTPFAGNKIPSNRINAIGQALINDYPLPNLPGTLGGFNNYVVSPNSQQDQYHSISSRVVPKP